MKQSVTLRQRLRNFYFSSLHVTILCVFLPLILIVVCTIGIISYQVVIGLVEQNAYTNTRVAVDQAGTYLDYRLNHLLELLVQLQDDNAIAELVGNLSNPKLNEVDSKTYIDVSASVSRVYNSDYSILDSVLVYFIQRKITFYQSYYPVHRIHFDFYQWRDRYYDNRSDIYWQNVHLDDVLQQSREKTPVLSLFRLVGDRDTKVQGIFLFNVKESFFAESLKNLYENQKNTVMLVSDNGVTTYGDPAPSRDRGLLAKVRQQEDTGYFEYRSRQGQELMVIYDTLRSNQWQLVVVLDKQDLLSGVTYAGYVITIAVVGIAVLAVIFSIFLARLVTDPLQKLTRRMQAIREDNFREMELAIPENSSNEIGVLSRNIFELLLRLKGLLLAVENEAREKYIARLSLLQAQINPHFLYNTLNSIQYYCRQGKVAEASRMIAALGDFFRISLSKGRDILSIREEVEHVRDYLLISSMGYGGDLQYQVEIEDDVYDYQIIKLTLQPLVENAILHGIKPKQGPGRIIIRGAKQADCICLEIEDNGVGIDPATLDRLNRMLVNWEAEYTGSLGLNNVNKRLKIQYGSEFGLSIASEINGYTKVYVRLPRKRQI